MKITNKHLIPEIILYILIGILLLTNISNPFFWDKDILDSIQANWFIENNFNLNFPDDIDPGHFPFISLILASIWTVFGKSLWISHLTMIIFTVGLIFQIRKLVNFVFTDNQNRLFAILFVLLNTSLLTQMVIISSDLVLCFFFVYSLNSIFYKKQAHLFFALTGLAIINLRGSLTAFGMSIFYTYYNFKELKFEIKILLKKYLPFILAALFPLAYIIFHYYNDGWFFMNENGQWSGCYTTVNLKFFIKNIFVFAWRMADSGRIIFWIADFIFLFILLKNKKIASNKNIADFLFLTSTLILIYLPSSLKYKILIDSRYYLPIFISLAILTVQLSSKIILAKKKNFYFGIIVCIFLISGNFWIYPDNISKCWSATLAHIPYHELRNEMNQYVENQEIDKKTIGSIVPNISSNKYVFLNDDNFSYKLIDFDEHKYIIMSNVFNAEDYILEELQKNWEEIKCLKKLQVKISLYKKKD